MPGGEYLQPNQNAAVSKPKELDAFDAFECGRAREYFGFDEYFINDKKICRDVGQFQNARDFDFLDEFFERGSVVEVEEEDGTPPLVPALVLSLPNTGKYLYEYGTCKNEWYRLAYLRFAFLLLS